jgi:branched-chain amino acid transport system substrate-binding protein
VSLDRTAGKAASGTTHDASRIVIAVLAPTARLERWKTAGALAARDVNEQGGINGNPLDVIAVDAGDGEIVSALNAARGVIEDPQCAAAVTGFVSATVVEMELFADAKMPYIVAEHSIAFQRRVSAASERFDTVWAIMPSYDPYGFAAAKFLSEAMQLAFGTDDRRAFVVHTGDEYSETCAEALALSLVRGGFAIAGSRRVDPTNDIDWPAIVNAAANSAANLLVSTAVEPDPASGLTRAFAEAPTNALLVIQYACRHAEYLDAVADVSADGILYNIIGGPIEDYEPTNQVRDRLSGVLRSAPDRYEIDIYQAVHLYANAARASVNPNQRHEVGIAIGSATGSLAQGQLRFDANTHLAVYGDDGIPMQWFQMQDGRPVRIAPANLASGSVRRPRWLP